MSNLLDTLTSALGYSKYLLFVLPVYGVGVWCLNALQQFQG